MPLYVLKLGSFTFNEVWLETPQALSGLGGTALVEQHDFPGGERTQQSFGVFPDMIKWSGKFTGSEAALRLQQVQVILYNAQQVNLTWADRCFAGLLVKFKPTARTVWHYDYECEFWPIADLTNASATYELTQQATSAAYTAVLNLHILALTSMLTLAAQGDTGPLFNNVAAALAGPITAALGSVASAMTGASQVITNIAPAVAATVQATILTAANAAQNLVNSPNPLVASPASDALSHLQGMSNTLTAVSAPVRTLQVVNPNLYALAAQYYGDATKWQLIANASGLTDPQPTGQFTLTVPPG